MCAEETSEERRVFESSVCTCMAVYLCALQEQSIACTAQLRSGDPVLPDIGLHTDTT